ncbi:hypothetical protein SO802_007587 [Lithocarpus litseifolius]|uniref:Gnk2-homologous domain-containing protein n=1 Tax=Lithocarpus litseifolius TaxID=425828 RepID=A0AAW2DQS9_9ROSI
MPVFDEELKGGVFEMVQNPVKEEELVCESKSNVNEEMKAEPVVEKTNEDLVKDEKIEGKAQEVELIMIMGLPQPCRFNLCTTLLVLYYFLISFLSHTRTEAVATYVYHNCPNTVTFTTNSTYQSNLNNLLTYLSFNATRNIEFYNATAGNSVDTVYGLFLCREDLPADTCQSCIADATKDIAQRCPTERE